MFRPQKIINISPILLAHILKTLKRNALTSIVPPIPAKFCSKGITGKKILLFS